MTYAQSGNWWDENAPEIEKAVAAAADVDCIVACIGENSYCETPGNLTDLTLSQNQSALVEALARTGKPIILILNEGRPRLVAKIEPLAKAVVDVMLPGNYGGDALANLLSGDANFSGKLPFTYPREINSLITYDYKPCEHIGKQMEGAYNYDAQVAVQWAFGYGLSYTRFAYDNFRVDKSSFTADDTLTFAVDVTNCGDRAGKESVLLFGSDLVASLSPDNRRLRAFEKIELQPGQTKTVELRIKGSDLAFVGYDGKWILEKGDFRMQAGDRLHRNQEMGYAQPIGSATEKRIYNRLSDTCPTAYYVACPSHYGHIGLCDRLEYDRSPRITGGTVYALTDFSGITTRNAATPGHDTIYKTSRTSYVRCPREETNRPTPSCL